MVSWFLLWLPVEIVSRGDHFSRSPELVASRCPQVRFSAKKAVILAQCASLLVLTCGCHSLRARRQTRALADARQNSLRGTEKLQQHKLQEAEFLFTEALRRSSADERAQAGMAEVLWQRGEHQPALEHMTKAVTTSGGNPDTLVRLGEMSLQLGMLDEALAAAESALENQRKHAGAWALRGRVLQQRSQFEEALTSYHRALSDQPKLPEVQIALAEIYRELGRPQRALATLDAMTDGQSKEQISPDAWMLKGLALVDLGETSAAKNCLRNAALCCRDEASDTLLAVARRQIEVGDYAEARICLGRAGRHDPDNPQTRYLQQLLEQQSQNEAQAKLVGFERPLSSNPSQPLAP